LRSHPQWRQDLQAPPAEISGFGRPQDGRSYRFVQYVLHDRYQVKSRSQFSFAIVDYLADSVDAFLTTHENMSPPGDEPHAAADTKTIPLGFTFSFPVEQSAIDSGKLLKWTKGFNVKNVVGQDVVKLLQDAFDRKRMNVKCVALVNDVRSPLNWTFIF
jgi:hexokinase